MDGHNEQKTTPNLVVETGKAILSKFNSPNREAHEKLLGFVRTDGTVPIDFIHTFFADDETNSSPRFNVLGIRKNIRSWYVLDNQDFTREEWNIIQDEIKRQHMKCKQ